MYSNKYIERLEKIEKSKSRRNSFNASILFLISAVILGPLIHEISHLTILEAINCGYSLNFGLGSYGLFATIQPLCSPGLIPLATFYSIGYLVTIIAGSYLIYTGISHIEKDRYWVPLISGSGLLASMLPTLWLKGDISNLTRILEAPEYNLLITGLLFLGCSYLVLKSLMLFWDRTSQNGSKVPA